MNPKVHVRIEAKGNALSRVSLSLADSFSFEIQGANPSLKESLITWLTQYSRAISLPFLKAELLSTLSPFHQKVLLEMSQIPFGTTLSYRELGERCGMASGARAIGGACSRNPLPLLIPCHRVIRTDGSLGGFSPDLEIKRRLLFFERQKSEVGMQKY